jgi:ATP-dependent helicase/DNAse subunit B
MNVCALPSGKAGWDEKTRILRELIASRPSPPFRYNDVLVLVPSSRMRRAYGRLFLELAESVHGTAALIQPDIQTLHLFFQRLAARAGSRLLIDENTRLVLLEGIVKERIAATGVFGRQPDILAPSLSAAVADMIEELSHARVAPERLSAAIAQADFSDKPQVKLLVDVYAIYEQVLADRDLVDPAGMLSALADRFDPSWLSSYSTIIVDGLHDADELQAQVLRKIAATADCTFLIDAPSADDVRTAGDYHPLRLTREFLGRIGLVPGNAGAAADPDGLFLARALFSEKPFADAARNAPPSFGRNIGILSAVNAREEVSFIAGEVKRSLRRGAVPDSLLVAFPSLDEYGPLAEEIFRDCGIPYNRALGRQLGASPVATAVISLLRACQEDFSGPSLLRIFGSPFLKFAEHPAVAPALDRFLRHRRITGGKHKLLSALRYHPPDETRADLISEPLNDLFAALGPFSSRDTAPLSTWLERLEKLIEWSGLGARVSLIKGPLNVNLQAYKKLSEALASLHAAGKLFPEYTYTFSEWLFLIKKTFMHARFQVPPEDEGGVQILGMEESIGRAWSEIYVGGLVDGKFPQRMPQNIVLPETALETLGIRTLERARLNAAHHFYRLLLSAEKVTLTWPENAGDKPVVPSPFLEELTPLKNAGLINRGIEKTSGIQFSLQVEESRSMPELAKALGVAGDVKGMEDVLSSDGKEISAIRAACEFKPVPAASAVQVNKREFRVTELDDYINCPYDYYIRHVLHIGPLEEVTEDISPLARGSKVHAVLRDFYREWQGPVTPANRDKAQRLLRGLAERSFEREADTFRNRREKELFLAVMAERFLDAEEEFWKQGMKPAYLEQMIGRFAVKLSDGTEAMIEGKIDRIDVDENGNFIIVDYKTGSYPRPKMDLDQDIFQLPVYAVMAQHALSGAGPSLKTPIGLAYYDLKGKTGAGARDVVLFNNEARSDHPSAKPRASSKSYGEFEAILERSMDKARAAVEGILAGDFTSEPRDENKCRYCANEMMCGERIT